MMELGKHGRPRRAQRRLLEGPHKRKHDARANQEHDFIGTCTFSTRHDRETLATGKADIPRMTQRCTCNPWVPHAGELLCAGEKLGSVILSSFLSMGLPCLFLPFLQQSLGLGSAHVRNLLLVVSGGPRPRAQQQAGDYP